MEEKNKEKIKQGKSNRISGAYFERKVRAESEEQGFIVSKWMNNVDLNESKIIASKQGRFRLTSTGFPDFIAYKRETCGNCVAHGFGECGFVIVGVEVKSNGYLKPEEKEKCKWYLKNKIFSRIYVASKGKKRGEIIYKEFKDE